MKPIVVAHRGASHAARENTVEAFRLAREMGAAMVELDVRRTRDNQLIVHHDPVIDGVAICTLDRSSLPSFVPTLAEALDACEGMEVNVEIKSDPSEPDYDASQPVAHATVALLNERDLQRDQRRDPERDQRRDLEPDQRRDLELDQRHGRARYDKARILISSFDRDTINVVRSLDPSLRTGFLFAVPPVPFDEVCAALAAEGHVAVHPHRKGAVDELVAVAHAHGLAVNVWTVDDPDEMRALAARGVDAIITNKPDLAITALGSAS